MQLKFGYTCFKVTDTVKNLKDTKEDDRPKQVTDLFLYMATCEAIIKVPLTVYTKQLEEMCFSQTQQNKS